MTDVTECHPELVSGSIRIRSRNKFGMTKLKKYYENTPQLAQRIC